MWPNFHRQNSNFWKKPVRIASLFPFNLLMHTRSLHDPRYPPYQDNLLSTALLQAVVCCNHICILKEKKENVLNEGKYRAAQVQKWRKWKHMVNTVKREGIVTKYRAMRWRKFSLDVLNFWSWNWYTRENANCGNVTWTNQWRHCSYCHHSDWRSCCGSLSWLGLHLFLWTLAKSRSTTSPGTARISW